METTFKVSEDTKQYQIRLGNAIIQSDYIEKEGIRVILKSLPDSEIDSLAKDELVYDINIEFPDEIKVAELEGDTLWVTTYYDSMGIYTHWPNWQEGVDPEPWFIDTDSIVAKIGDTYFNLEALEYARDREALKVMYRPTGGEQVDIERLFR